ncbi:unnamed protein product [Rhizophagus irregularis]|nr:unnamed protein product [Rhizophagus irregularis]
MEIAFKWRERRWQHREETMATNREREVERDLDVREKEIRDREIMARKLAEWGDDIEADSDHAEYYKDRSRCVKPELTLNLASKRRAALMALAEDEEFDDEEGGLWNWNVKWEELDENILNKKL